MSRRDKVQQARAITHPFETEKVVSLIPKIQKFEYLNEPQERYGRAIENFQLVFGVGPAGTGKTYVCGALAAEALRDRRIDKIVLTRPAVEAGESLGFLPGDKDEKYDPWLQPFYDVLHERLGKTATEYHIRHGNIEGAPLAYMRGRTFRNAFVILDEAQNTTPEQMKMFLTRIGQGCTVVVNGDITQKDTHGLCGLEDAINRTSYIPAIKVIEFSRHDIVRSGLVQEIVEAYEVSIN